MTDLMYRASVPVFKQMLGSITELLVTAEQHATSRGITPAALLDTRLFPDMFPLHRQVQIACDFARGVSARLAGVDVPVYEGNEREFDELRMLVAKSEAFIGGIDRTRFVDSAAREIVTRPGTPKERHFHGRDYLFSYGLPQFFFHVSAVYMLLRHNGVEIGKKDYIGAY